MTIIPVYSLTAVLGNLTVVFLFDDLTLFVYYQYIITYLINLPITCLYYYLALWATTCYLHLV